MSESSSSSLITNLKELYEWIIKQGDPRLKDWLFVSSPIPAVTAVVLYLLFVWQGPKVMADRKPFHLGYILALYNFALVVLSTYMVYEFFMSSYLAGYTLRCQPVDYSKTPLAMKVANVCWWYYISKYLETFDTIFFILRKKNNQVTVLHVYHHSTMLFNWWMAVNFIAGGAVTFHAMVNSFVHVIMYSYYGLSALGPKVRPYLWWKKYVTKIQLTQFAIVMVHSCQCLTRQDCIPFWFVVYAVFYAISMIVLFTNYYYRERKREESGLKLQQQQITKSYRNGSGHGSNGKQFSNGAQKAKSHEE